MTNLQYSKDPTFMSACATADIPATRRQASKYRNQRGAAWSQRGKARKVKAQEDASCAVCWSLMTVPELRDACRARGIKGYSKLRKAELLSLLAD
jgi:hypothetical protein